MGNLSKELSSWRKQVVTCKSGIITTIDFMDTRPNIMFIMNPTEAVLLASIDHSPTPKNYDFKIKGHYTRLIGKPTRTRQCYIYNDSSIDCDVQVYSLYDEKFDPSWIKDFNIENVNISSETLETIKEMITGKVVIDGVKEGVVLPVKDSEISDRIRHLYDNKTYENIVNLKLLMDTVNHNFSLLSSGNKVNLVNLNDNVVSLKNTLINVTSYINANSKYMSLTGNANFNKTFSSYIRFRISHIMGNGTLQIINGDETQNIPVNGFLRDIQITGNDITIKYIKPTDELENAHIIYKYW